MKLYLVNTYGGQVDSDPFVVDEDGLETFKSKMKQAKKKHILTNMP